MMKPITQSRRSDLLQNQTVILKRIQYTVEGRVHLEGLKSLKDETQLLAYVFDKHGHLIGISDVNPNGDFRVNVRLSQASDVELVIAPADDPKRARKSTGYKQSFAAHEWTIKNGRMQLKSYIYIPQRIWWNFRPVQVYLSGQIHKLQSGAAIAVAGIKVELYEVDRDGFLWAFINRWWDKLADRRVARISDLIKERPKIEVGPLPDPLGPSERMGSTLTSLIPDMKTHAAAPESNIQQPEVVRNWMTDIMMPSASEMKNLDNLLPEWEDNLTPIVTSVGEVKALNPAVAARLRDLTITSRVAPWFMFPRSFYKHELICETTTDEHGQFKSWFGWSPFQRRRGRLRYDSRPDLILRVTQVVNGVQRVVYLDPYTSIQWNLTNASLDLYLDNEEIQLGSIDASYGEDRYTHV
jgi:hypothetical protein